MRPSDKPIPNAELLRLDGRVALVTGAARGIGRAISARLAEAGAVVLVTDLDEEAARATAAELPGLGHRSLRLDVGDPAAVDAAADHAVGELGGLDIWVNNAGIYPVSASDPIETAAPEFERVLHVNLTGTYLGIQASARRMRPGGVVLNLDSTEGYEGTGAYSASKWAVRGMTKGIAPVLAERGIRVVAVAPTLIETPGIGEMRATAPDRFEAVAPEVPLGRVGDPDDVARAALFLVSDAASFITGITLPVDGGALAG